MEQDGAPSSPYSVEVAAAINVAYEQALGRLQISSMEFERRAALGRFLMEAAEAGETDEVKLRDGAVAAMNRFDWLRFQAHEIWEMEGRPHGRDRAHWEQAELEWSERRQPPA